MAAHNNNGQWNYAPNNGGYPEGFQPNWFVPIADFPNQGQDEDQDEDDEVEIVSEGEEEPAHVGNHPFSIARELSIQRRINALVDRLNEMPWATQGEDFLRQNRDMNIDQLQNPAFPAAWRPWIRAVDRWMTEILDNYSDAVHLPNLVPPLVRDVWRDYSRPPPTGGGYKIPKRYL